MVPTFQLYIEDLQNIRESSPSDAFRAEINSWIDHLIEDRTSSSMFSVVSASMSGYVELKPEMEGDFNWGGVVFPSYQSFLDPLTDESKKEVLKEDL